MILNVNVCVSLDRASVVVFIFTAHQLMVARFSYATSAMSPQPMAQVMYQAAKHEVYSNVVQKQTQYSLYMPLHEILDYKQFSIFSFEYVFSELIRYYSFDVLKIIKFDRKQI